MANQPGGYPSSEHFERDADGSCNTDLRASVAGSQEVSYHLAGKAQDSEVEKSTSERGQECLMAEIQPEVRFGSFQNC